MRRDERRVILGWIYVVIAIACCIAGFITLRHDQIGAGVVFMAAMYGIALYADHMFSVINDHEEHDNLLRLVEDEE